MDREQKTRVLKANVSSAIKRLKKVREQSFLLDYDLALDFEILIKNIEQLEGLYKLLEQKDEFPF